MAAVELVAPVEQVDVGAQVGQVLIVGAGCRAAGGGEGGLLLGRVRPPEHRGDRVPAHAGRRRSPVAAVVGGETRRRVDRPGHLLGPAGTRHAAARRAPGAGCRRRRDASRRAGARPRDSRPGTGGSGADGDVAGPTSAGAARHRARSSGARGLHVLARLVDGRDEGEDEDEGGEGDGHGRVTPRQSGQVAPHHGLDLAAVEPRRRRARSRRHGTSGPIPTATSDAT